MLFDKTNSRPVRQDNYLQMRLTLRRYIKLPLATLALAGVMLSGAALGQGDVVEVNQSLKEELRWQNQEAILQRFGEPLKRGATRGTHADYSLWEYSEFFVAFANQRVTHVFEKDSLRTQE